MKKSASFGLAVIAVAFSIAALAAPKITGIAFVDSAVTSMGSRAKLPAGAKIYPPGSTISGKEGCPTDQYGTTGLIVAIIDYEGRPIAASLQVIRMPAGGGRFENAPYYIDLNPGRTLQYLGPIRENGVYELKFEGGFGKAAAEQVKAPIVTFTLARSCAR